MRNFLPTAGRADRPRSFFAAFGKFGAVTADHFEPTWWSTCSPLRRAVGAICRTDDVVFVGDDERKPWSKAIAGKSTYQAKLEALKAAGLADLVETKKQRTRQSRSSRSKRLRDCDAGKDQARLRGELPLHRPGLAQRQPRRRLRADRDRGGAGARRADGRRPSIIVQAEDTASRARDYTRAHGDRSVSSPKAVPEGASSALHAGELWLGLVPPRRSRPSTSARRSRSPARSASATASTLAYEQRQRRAARRDAQAARSRSRSTSPATT